MNINAKTLKILPNVVYQYSKHHYSQLPKYRNNSDVLSWCTDKLNVVYTHSGMLFGCKEQWNLDACYNMDEYWKHHVNKDNKWDTKEQIFYDFTYERYLEQAHS